MIYYIYREVSFEVSRVNSLNVREAGNGSQGEGIELKEETRDKPFSILVSRQESHPHVLVYQKHWVVLHGKFFFILLKVVQE